MGKVAGLGDLSRDRGVEGRMKRVSEVSLCWVPYALHLLPSSRTTS